MLIIKSSCSGFIKIAQEFLLLPWKWSNQSLYLNQSQHQFSEVPELLDFPHGTESDQCQEHLQKEQEKLVLSLKAVNLDLFVDEGSNSSTFLFPLSATFEGPGSSEIGEKTHEPLSELALELSMIFSLSSTACQNLLPSYESTSSPDQIGF